MDVILLFIFLETFISCVADDTYNIKRKELVLYIINKIESKWTFELRKLEVIELNEEIYISVRYLCYVFNMLG